MSTPHADEGVLERGSQPTIEIVSERGMTYQPGTAISGKLRMFGPEGWTAARVDLRIEREHRDQTVVLRHKPSVAELIEGTTTEPFVVRFPEGAFGHDSNRIPVKLWLVAFVPQHPEVSAKWRLFGGVNVHARTRDDVRQDYEEVRGTFKVPTLFLVLLIPILGFFGYAFSWAMSVIAVMMFFGIAGLLLLWFLADDVESEMAGAEHLDAISLSVSPTLDGTALLATATISTGETPEIERISFRWWGSEDTRSSTMADWSRNCFSSFHDEVVEHLDLAPHTRYEFSSDFRLPAEASPSFEMDRERIEWGVDVMINLRDAPMQKLSTTFDVELMPHEFGEPGSSSVVATESVESVVSKG